MFYNRSRTLNINANNLVKSVGCDQPCSEGYEYGNLVCNNLLERNKGFLVERFIKPPVTLTFEFTCDIDVRYIVIICNVGAQKSSGIELFTQSSASPDKRFESVASGVLKGNENGFIFHRFSEDVKTKFGEGFNFRYFRSAGNLSCVKSLRIKIFKTEGSSVPALGKLDIFGIPYNYFPKTLDYKDLTHTHGSNEMSHSKRTILEVEYEGDVQQSSKGKITENSEIPNDFIDPITLEFMIQPVTLPSGNVIDISTLEMFEKAESHWGRGLSDPFTGVPFTSYSKPVVATDLKARIDKFLSNNSDHPRLKNVPRTIGHAHGSFMPFKKLTQTVKISKLITNTEQTPSGSSLTSFSTGKCEVPCKKIKVEKNVNQDCQSYSQGTDIRKEVVDKLDKRPIETISNLERERPTIVSFQEKMERSLESSLKTTLSSLPSFTSDKVCEKEILVECNICKIGDNIFSLPCCHFICRGCLIELKQEGTMSCLLCGYVFKSYDVKKVHINE